MANFDGAALGREIVAAVKVYVDNSIVAFDAKYAALDAKLSAIDAKFADFLTRGSAEEVVSGFVRSVMPANVPDRLSELQSNIDLIQVEHNHLKTAAHDAMAEVIKRLTDQHQALIDRVPDLIVAQVNEMKDQFKGDPGKDASVAHLEVRVDELVSSTHLELSKTIAAQQEEFQRVLQDVQGSIERSFSAVTDAVKNLPVPKDGKDADIKPFEEAWNASFKKYEELVSSILRDVSVKVKEVEEATQATIDARGASAEAVLRLEETLKRDRDTFQKDLTSMMAERHRENYEQLKAQIEAAVKDIPPGKDGLDGKDGAPGLNGKDGQDGVNGLDGKDGRDGNDGKDGRDGNDGKDGANGKDGLNGKDGEKGLDGKDGLGLAGMMINQKGELVATLSDGTVKEIGRVGVDPVEIERLVAEKTANIKDGKDGVGYDDLVEILEEDGRTITRRYMKGDQVVKEYKHKFPVILDAGIYDRSKSYDRGDAVSYEGSMWVSKRDSNVSLPGTNADWRLAVKRGRDAKPVVLNPKKDTKVKIDD